MMLAFAWLKGGYYRLYGRGLQCGGGGRNS
jgi:hypothetical protein